MKSLGAKTGNDEKYIPEVYKKQERVSLFVGKPSFYTCIYLITRRNGAKYYQSPDGLFLSQPPS